MRRIWAVSIATLLGGLSACDGSYVVDPNDPRLDLTAATTERFGSPIIYLDGVRISEAEMRQLDTDRISTIEILKGPAALALHGTVARDGVVYISLKR